MSISLRDDILNAVKDAGNKTFMFNAEQLCPLQTPCGWCAKWDKKCDKKIGCNNDKFLNIIDELKNGIQPIISPHDAEEGLKNRL